MKQLEKDNRQQGIAAKPMVEVGETRGGMQLSFFQLDDPVLWGKPLLAIPSPK